MTNRSNDHNHYPEPFSQQDSNVPVDYIWFNKQFQSLQRHITTLEDSITAIEKHAAENSLPAQPTTREYYSVQEFAEQVERSEFTVREWCRLFRINAEKCETGRGDAKNWKIVVDELQRYRDHGLLPVKYPR